LLAPVKSTRVFLDFYRHLTQALAEQKGAAHLWLEGIRPMLDWVDAQRGFAKRTPIAEGQSPVPPQAQR
jgi:hypothetical protein